LHVDAVRCLGVAFTGVYVTQRRRVDDDVRTEFQTRGSYRLGFGQIETGQHA
jgi:hypothetical protein